jgi:hypothetical protein
MTKKAAFDRHGFHAWSAFKNENAAEAFNERNRAQCQGHLKRSAKSLTPKLTGGNA